jgi:hypothetical protein
MCPTKNRYKKFTNSNDKNTKTPQKFQINQVVFLTSQRVKPPPQVQIKPFLHFLFLIFNFIHIGSLVI